MPNHLEDRCIGLIKSNSFKNSSNVNNKVRVFTDKILNIIEKRHINKMEDYSYFYVLYAYNLCVLHTYFTEKSWSTSLLRPHELLTVFNTTTYSHMSWDPIFYYYCCCCCWLNSPRCPPTSTSWVLGLQVRGIEPLMKDILFPLTPIWICTLNRPHLLFSKQWKY